MAAAVTTAAAVAAVKLIGGGGFPPPLFVSCSRQLACFAGSDMLQKLSLCSQNPPSLLSSVRQDDPCYSVLFCEKIKDVLILLGFEKNNGIYEGDIPTLLKGSCCKKSGV